MRQLSERSKFNIIKTVNDFIISPQNSIEDKKMFVKMLNENYSYNGLDPFEILGKRTIHGFFESLIINEFFLDKTLETNRTDLMFRGVLTGSETEQEFIISFNRFRYAVELFSNRYEREYQ